jgi:plastocyanin
MKGTFWVLLIIAIVAIVGVFIILNYPTAKTQVGSSNPGQSNQQSSESNSLPQASVTISNFAFNPATLTISKGTTVTWTNQDSTQHTIKSSSFNSQTLNKGGTFEFKFDNAGTYDYSCGIHPSMKGKIIVQ